MAIREHSRDPLIGASQTCPGYRERRRTELAALGSTAWLFAWCQSSPDIRRSATVSQPPDRGARHLFGADATADRRQTSECPGLPQVTRRVSAGDLSGQLSPIGTASSIARTVFVLDSVNPKPMGCALSHRRTPLSGVCGSGRVAPLHLVHVFIRTVLHCWSSQYPR